MRNKPIVQSVDRAIAILSLFRKHRSLGITQIANEMGLAKSTVYGLAATLEKNHFLQQNTSTGSYSLGIGLFEMGELFSQRLDLRREAAPVMHELVDKYSETVQISILDGREVVYLDLIEGSNALKFSAGIGSRAYANCTATGKVMLADLPDEALDGMYSDEPLPIRTPRSIQSLVSLKEHLKLVREQGYSIDDEEFEVGVRAVSVGIRNHQGKVIAAISLGGPATRVTYEILPELISSLKEATNTISSRLGF
ncbi:MAG: IclR family transcriptional regulator [Desulfitobacteriaceae bacterium]